MLRLFQSLNYHLTHPPTIQWTETKSIYKSSFQRGLSITTQSPPIYFHCILIYWTCSGGFGHASHPAMMPAPGTLSHLDQEIIPSDIYSQVCLNNHDL